MPKTGQWGPNSILAMTSPDVYEERDNGAVLGHEPHDGVQAEVHALHHHAFAARLSISAYCLAPGSVDFKFQRSNGGR